MQGVLIKIKGLMCDIAMAEAIAIRGVVFALVNGCWLFTRSLSAHFPLVFKAPGYLIFLIGF